MTCDGRYEAAHGAEVVVMLTHASCKRLQALQKEVL